MAVEIATNFGESSSAAQYTNYFAEETGNAPNHEIQGTYSSIHGFSNGKGMSLMCSGGTVTAIVTLRNDYYNHFRWRGISGNDGIQTLIVGYIETSVAHIFIVRNADGTISLCRAAVGTVLATSSTIVPHLVSAHFVFRGTIADSGGRGVVWYNGLSTPIIDFTGDTRNAGTGAGINRTRFYEGSFTDWVLINTVSTPTGTPTGNMGSVRVTNHVMGGNGAVGVQFTPSAGSNYQNIDDTMPGLYDSDSTYNESSTTGHIDWFAPLSDDFTDLSAASVKTVALKYAARATDATLVEVRGKCKSSSTVGNGTTITLGTTYPNRQSWYMDEFPRDPATSAAWASLTAVRDAQWGYEKVT